MRLDCNSDRNRLGKNPVSIQGIMILLSVFLFLGNPQILIADSNDTDTASSGKSSFSWIALAGGKYNKEEHSFAYTSATFNFGGAVITADNFKIFLKKGASGELPQDEGSTENIEDSFEKVVATGNVNVVFEDLVATGDNAVYDPAVGTFALTGDPEIAANTAGTMSSSEITAERIVLNREDAETVLIGNVRFTRGETVITADNVKTFSKKDSGGGSTLTDGALEKAKESFEKIVATGSVEIVFNGLVATGDKAVYDPTVGTFVLTGDPATIVDNADTISSAEITAERIILNRTDAEAKLIGNARFTRGETVITADNLKASLKKDLDVGSSRIGRALEKVEESFKKIVAAGNVKTVFKGLVATGDKAVYDLVAQSFVLTGDPATLLNGAGAMSLAEIKADRIVFNNMEFSAKFIGNAIITQGENVITADSMNAFLKRSMVGKLPLNEGSTENIEDSFEKIVAKGNVKIVVEGDVATGDEAVYDSAVGSFILSGNPATLVSGVITSSAPVVEVIGIL